MNFQIKSLVLWSKNPQRKPRVLPFETGTVNVISGASRTGKSAIVPIIDYCLGSETCSIPVGIIRDNCEWFGIVVQTDEGQKLFARREPGNQTSTGDMFLAEEPRMRIPDAIAKNITVEAVKQKLNALSGLTSLDFSVSDEVGQFTARPGFRDLAAFLFQSQNIIANPHVLFYKADSYEHQERLRSVIPYVLNALTPDLMAKQHELKELERELTRSEKELRAYEATSAEFKARVGLLTTEALELGLLSDVPVAATPIGRQLDILKTLSARTDAMPTATGAALSKVDDRLLELKASESTVAGQLVGLRRRQQDITSLRDSARNYEAAVSVQKERLGVSRWLLHQRKGNEKCPLCGSTQQPAEKELEAFVEALQNLEAGSASFEVVPSTLDRELSLVRQDLNSTIENLNAIQLQIREIEQSSNESQERRFTESNAARFLGRLEANLSVLNRTVIDSDLRLKIEKLRVVIEPLRAAIRAANIAAKEKAAIGNIDNHANRYVEGLDAEDPTLPIRFQRNDLSLKVVRGQREDFLWELGSGSNWLSYHIALALAFQRFFISQKESPVPSFLVMDQPSQVYFPKTLANRPGKDDADPPFTDADVQAVRKVFATLAKATMDVPGQLQIIVLDHAAEPVWQGIQNIHFVEEWRGSKKLVPLDWLT